jgi:hypothetical protein
VISQAVASLLLPLAEAKPAGGAEPLQVAIATGGASIATGALLVLAHGHRTGRINLLARIAAFFERVSGLPGWAAFPGIVAGLALNVALLGMYWDIALHIDQGRDPGPLANPAHYFILAGLFGVFAAGVLAIVLPKGDRPAGGGIRIAPGWYAPIGGVLTAVCGAFALIAFPLDDVWHRLFGQDVTLWGPTHLMLIGGAGLSLIGQCVLLAEGMRSRKGTPRLRSGPRMVASIRRIGLLGGLLIGLSTFQAEFDFGVPQYRLVLQPLLIAGAAGVALVAARLWIGRGGAIGAALFFIVTRGAVSLLVGPVIGETTPAIPLYLAEALLVEGAALAFAGRPLAIGATSGALIGTVGLGAEWGWTQIAYRLPWNADILPEAVLAATVTGVAAGLLGALLALGLRGELPRPGIARAIAVLSICAIGVSVAAGVVTSEPSGASATLALTDENSPAKGREANATVRFDPPTLADSPAWITATAWQGGGLHVDKLTRIGEGVYRTTEPIPVHGDWKSIIRLQNGRQVLGVPVFLPADPAIPAAEVPAPASVTRPVQADAEILQRERDFGVPSWLWGGASLVVLGLFALLLGTLAWGVGRVARRDEPPAPRPRARDWVGVPAAAGNG